MRICTECRASPHARRFFNPKTVAAIRATDAAHSVRQSYLRISRSLLSLALSTQ